MPLVTFADKTGSFIKGAEVDANFSEVMASAALANAGLMMKLDLGGDASASLFKVVGASASITVAEDAAFWADARMFEVVADGVIAVDITTNSNSPIISSLVVPFTAYYVGKAISISGAGPSGATLNTTIASVNGLLATLAVNASTSQTSSARAVYGTDDTEAVNNAWASGYPIRMPLTAMRICGQLNIPDLHTRVHFPSRTQGGFIIGNDFNMSASSVVYTNIPLADTGGTGANAGPIITNMRIFFAQPNSTNIADYTQYPPAFQALSSARLRLISPRIVNGWRGLVFGANCGGLICTDLESMCYYTNVEMDGNTDSMRFYNPHIWPVECLDNQFAVFFAAACSGWIIGRCDDYKIIGGLTICGTSVVQEEGNLAPPLNGAGFGVWIGHDFDTFSSIYVYSGVAIFSACELTMGPFALATGTINPNCGILKGGESTVILDGSFMLLGGALNRSVMIEDISNDLSFQGSITGTLLVVTTMNSGRVGFNTLTSGAAAGTEILYQVSGIKAGIGTYQVSIAQTVATNTTMTAELSPQGGLCINGGTWNTYAVDQELVQMTGNRANVLIQGVQINKTIGISYTKPMIKAIAGRGTLNGLHFSPTGTGTGVAVEADVGVKLLASNLNLGGYTINDMSGGSASITTGNLA